MFSLKNLAHKGLTIDRSWNVPEEGFRMCFSGINPKVLSMYIQSAAIITWSNISWYYKLHCNDSNRTWTSVWTHETHPITHPDGQAMGCCLLTLNVQGLSYLGLTRSISWLLMPWLLTSPGHQQPWYWQYSICRSFSYLRKDFKYLCHINVHEWQKM